MRQMLCIIMLFALWASTLSVESSHDAVLEKCKIELKVTEDRLSKINSTDPEELLRDPETRCFVACIYTEKKLLKSDGTLNVTSLIEMLPKDIPNREEGIEVYEACSNEKGADSCETAYKSIACINRRSSLSSTA